MALEPQSVKSRSRHRARRQPFSWKAKLIAGAVGLLLVWQTSVISLAAGHGDYGDDIKAADYASVSPAAAAAAAGQRLTDGDFDGAKAFATRALSVSPISADSLRDLGLAKQGLNDWQGSGAIFSQAAALGWHDVPTQLWLAQAFLQQKDYEAASQRLDAALRTTPNSTRLYDIVDRLAATPQFVRPMADRLALNPDWRPYYFAHVDSVSKTSLLARSQLLIALSTSPLPPSRQEVIPILFHLIYEDETPLARLLWLRSQHLKTGNIYDPNFTQTGTIGLTPFEWSITSVPGATFSAVQRGPDTIMHAGTDGTASGILLRQATALPSGAHKLNYVGSIPSAARDAFGWRVRCIRTGKILLSSLGTLAPPPYSFEVPVNCVGQWVELLASTSASAAGSEATFKSLNIDYPS